MITALVCPKRRRGRVSVFLDGRFAFSLAYPLAEEARLEVGGGLSSSQAEALRREDRHYACLEAALRLLSYRPQSQGELVAKLRRRFDPEVVEGALASLKGRGLVDDATFARFWAEDRQAYRPRSGRLLRRELGLKGVAPELVEAALEGLNDEESAYRAAQKKARTLEGSDFASFQRRLGGFLLRRGFGYQISRFTVNRLWREGLGGSGPLREMGR